MSMIASFRPLERADRPPFTISDVERDSVFAYVVGGIVETAEIVHVGRRDVFYRRRAGHPMGTAASMRTSLFLAIVNRPDSRRLHRGGMSAAA